MSGTPAPQQVWAALSQEQRDAAYNNNAAVATSADWVAARDPLAAAYRAENAGHLDLAYGSGARQAWDLYPAADPSAPCLVFVHGGYWQRNSREVFAHYAEGMRAAGWAVAMPSHTLAPEATLTTIVAEIGDALDWLAREGRTFGVAGPIVLSGWSAGGHLTAMLLGHASVVAGLAMSGVFDLAPIRDTFLDAALTLTEDEIATLSPLRLPVTMKPLAIAYGTAELPALIHDSVALHALREAAGAPGPLLPIGGADHFSILEELRRPDGALVQAAQDLLATTRAEASAA